MFIAEEFDAKGIFLRITDVLIIKLTRSILQ